MFNIEWKLQMFSFSLHAHCGLHSYLDTEILVDIDLIAGSRDGNGDTQSLLWRGGHSYFICFPCFSCFFGAVKTVFISFLFFPCKDILIGILLGGIDLLAGNSNGIGCDTLSLL